MYNNFDLNLYKTFYFVAKYKNFTKAAQELFISQPAVTQAIKKLQSQLNVELFKRTADGIELTPAGEIVYFYSERLYELALGNKNMIAHAREASFERITIGVPTHIGTFYLIKYLKKFNSIHPNVRINIINKRSDEMLKMLIKRELDIVIDTDMIEYDSEMITTKKTIDLQGCFVCSKKFKNIADKGIISAEELSRYPLILPGDTTSNRKSIDTYFKKKNITLSPLIEVNSSSISKKIIQQGIGIGWMIKEFVEEDIENKELFEVKVDIDTVKIPINIAYNKNFNHEIIQEFINMFKQT